MSFFSRRNTLKITDVLDYRSDRLRIRKREMFEKTVLSLPARLESVLDEM